MRILLLPALALIVGYPAFAQDYGHDWKYRSHRDQRHEIYRENSEYDHRDWHQPRFEHRRYQRPWYPERDEVVVHPEPQFIHVHPLPLPPPPPVRFHLWFGF